MTLIISEVSRLGIAMVADSAYTPHGGGQIVYHPKVFGSARLGVGISLWGNYLPPHPEQWVPSFLSREEGLGSLTVHDVAAHLERELRAACPQAQPTPGLDATVGFHVAGFDSGFPILYHVHNGTSQTLAGRGIGVNPQLINANPDIDLPTSKALMSSTTTASYFVRNGDFRLYAIMSSLLDPLLAPLDPLRLGAGLTTAFGHLLIPGSNTLRNRADYLAVQVRMVASLLGVSNIAAMLGTSAPHIGGDVLALELNGTTPPLPPRVAAV